MESNKYNIENFERFLRDKTDEFKLYPSKKVWYSIYNNMHPGNRLPSVSMSVILIGFLFLIGYLNTGVNKEIPAGNTSKFKAATERVIIASNQEQANNTLLFIEPAPVKTGKQYATFSPAQLNNITPELNAVTYRQTTSIVKQKAQRRIASSPTAKVNTNNITTENDYSPANAGANIVSSISKTNVAAQQNNVGAFNNTNELVTGIAAISIVGGLVDEEETGRIQQAAGSVSISNTSEVAAPVTTKKEEPAIVAKANKVSVISQPDKEWIEDFAMHNKPAAKKWAGKLSLQAYITPSVVYRKLRNNATDKMLSGNTNDNYNNFNAEDAVTHKPSFGLETGLSLQYDVAKRIKLKMGMQLNYTRYNAHAFETNHPIATSVTMNANDDILTYEVFKTSIYSNTFGLSPIKLHNETYQLSLPIGADFKLASLDNLSWYAGATIQPTVILYGKSYIISTDRRSYVQDPALLNRFNVNAGIETYISYKTNSGYTWQLGPQYRTQIFSTNTKVYSVEERLQNFGFKIGVTKKL